MYGWKGRIGLILPTRNTTAEPEFYRMAPYGVSVHTTRVEKGDTTPEGLSDMEEEFYRAARLLKGLGLDLIVVGCTSGTLIKGLGYDKIISARITDLTTVPSLTTATAVIEALRILKIRRVALATPYTDEVNQKEKEFLEGNGIVVTRMRGLGYSRPAVSYPLASRPVGMTGLLGPEAAYKLGLDVNTNDADGIFISCTNFRTIEIINTLESNTGKPVITSNQATMAVALKLMGIRERICGFGMLMEHHS
jgi:maleate isomerase